MRKAILLAGCLSAVTMGSTVAAQTSPEQRDDGNADEIVVTAEKRAESIYDLPIAIAAYSGATLERAGVSDLRSLQTQSPSLNIGDKGSETFISIRGIGSEVASIGSEAGVTVSQDGVSFARNMFFNADFMDVERVEVLRGPQGTISGRNATGGAINVISRQPTDAFEGSIGVTVGNRNRLATQGYVSGRLVGPILARFAFSTDNSDGWLRDVANDQRLGARNPTHARAIFATDFGGPIEATVTLEGLVDRSLPTGYFNIGRANPALPSLGEYFGVPDADLDRMIVSNSQRRDFKREQYGASLRVNWDLAPSVQLTSTTGYWDLFIKDTQDTDGTLAEVGDFPTFNWDLWQFSQELTLTADVTDRIDLIVGGQYLREYAAQPIDYHAADLGVATFVDLPEQDLNSYAAYGQVRFRLTDALRVSAGVRYTHDNKSYRELVFGVLPLGPIERSWSAVTPRFSVDYAINDDLKMFANIARGFKAGGINTLSLAFGGSQFFEPEYVWNYEGGIKGSAVDDRVHFALTGFHMDYKDIQQTLYVAGAAGAPPSATVVNADSAKIKGVELEFDARLTDQFKIGLSGTRLSAKIGDFLSVNPIEVSPAPVRNFAGNRLSRSPKWQFAINGEYTTNLSNDLTLSLRADFSWRDRQFFDVYNNPTISQGAYGLLNLNLELKNVADNWSLALFGRNVTDRRYRSNGLSSSIVPNVPQNLASPGEPVSYGATATFRF